MTPAVAVVVVHHGDRAVTRRCLDSLRATNLRVVLVDNDEASELWPDLGAGVEVITCGGNLGYGAAANRGFQRAFELAPYALLMNNDLVVVEPGFVDELVAALEEDGKAGIAGPLVVYPGGTPQPTVERWPSFWRAVWLVLRRRTPNANPPSGPVEVVNGVCMLLNRRVFDATGGFDESYFMYGEESDLCYRSAVAGFGTNYVAVRSVVHHHAPGESRSDSYSRIRVNYVRFCRDHRGPISATSVAVLFLLGAALRGQRPLELARRFSRDLIVEGTDGDELLAAIDRVALPLLLAAWVVLLALGSSFSHVLHRLGSGGKFAVLVLLMAIEIPRIVMYRRRYLDQLRFGYVHVAALAFVVVAAVSALWSPDPRHTLDMSAGLALLAGALLLAPWRLVQTESGARTVVDGVLGGLAVVVVGEVAAFVLFPNEAWLQPAGSTARFRGFLENPDEIGAYFFLAPVVLWRVWPLLRGPRLRLPRSVTLTVLYFGEVLASVSRAAIIFLFVVMALYIVGRRYRVRTTIATFGVLVVVLTAGTYLVVSPTLAGINWPSFVRPASLTTLGGRTQATIAAGRLIHRRPIAGFGFGTEELMVSQFREEGARLYQACLDARQVGGPTVAAYVASCDRDLPRRVRLGDFAGNFVHDSYLGLGIQLGAIVLGLAVLALVLAILSVGLAIRPGADLLTASFAAAVGGALWAVFSTYLWNPGNIVAGLFWLILLLGLAQGRRQRTGDDLVATTAN